MPAEPESAPGGAEPASPHHPGDLRSLARGGTLNLVGNVLGAVLGFALVVIVTRGLGPDPRPAGVFFAAVALFMILANTTELGADTGLVRFIARYRALDRTGDIRPTVRAALIPVGIAGVVAALVVFVFAEQIADVLIDGEAGDVYLRVFAPMLAIASMSTVLLQGCRGFGTMLPFVAVENVGKPAARAGLALVVVWAGLGATALAWSWALPVAAGFAVAALVMARLIRREETLGGATPTERPRVLRREFWLFSVPRAFAGFFQISIVWLDVLLVSALSSSTEAGVYAATSRLVTVGTFALQAIRLAIAPQLSSMLSRGEQDRAQRLYQIATWWLIGFSWPLYLTFAIFAPFVLGIFGPEYPSGQHALVILSLAMLVNLGTGNVTVVLLMGGKSSWNLFNAAGALTINVVLNLLLVPRYGMEGAAVAWAASILFDNAAALLEVWLLIGIRPFGPGYLRAAGGALVCFGLVGLAVRGALGESWLAVAVYLAVAALLYVPLLWRSRRSLHLDELFAALRPTAGAAATDDA